MATSGTRSGKEHAPGLSHASREQSAFSADHRPAAGDGPVRWGSWISVTWSRGTGRWLIGAVIAVTTWSLAGGVFFRIETATDVVAVVLVCLSLLLFLVLPPLSWRSSERVKLLLWLAILLPSLVLVYLSGTESVWFFTFVNTAVGMQLHRRYLGVALTLLNTVLAGLVGYLSPGGDAAMFPALIVCASVGLMLAAFGRQIEISRRLRITQQELAEVAVAEERNRLGRDMHDILGHSLTVISVKAELAARLVDVDPVRAGAEIAEVQDLARGALVDVRATVGGYRGVNILTELASAKAALAAAEIRAELPTVSDAVPARYRELFGWVLREAVTNVIRHSGARRVWVSMGSGYIQIDDDGAGPATAGTGTGTGLTGLRERVAAAGASLRIGRSDHGGYLLRVSV